MFTHWSKTLIFLGSSSWTILVEVEENFIQNLSPFLLFFWWQKKKVLRALLTCTFIRLLLNSFDLRSYNSKSININIVVVVSVQHRCYVSRSAEGRVILFSCERLGRDLCETIVSSFLKFPISLQNTEIHIHRSQYGGD